MVAVATLTVLLYNRCEVIDATDIVNKSQSPLFYGISQTDRAAMPGCIGYHIAAFHHRLIENMVRIIASKNHDLMHKVEVISKKTLREKILAYLSIHARIQNARYFEVPLGRVEWSEHLCADRSALTREFTNMKADGLIDYDKNCFRIL